MNTQLEHIIDQAVATITRHAEELTELDQAIGDGDHGINMRRGCEAIAATREQWRELAPGAVVRKIGMTLVMKVGGASGALYGSFFIAAGDQIPGPPTAEALVAAFAAGVDSVRKRGRSEAGEKTMLDVLVPVGETLRAGVSDGHDTGTLLADIVDTAAAGLEATRPMRATKGRASYLGERSIGHLDPGAMSSYLLVKSTCTCLGGEA